MPGTWLDTMKTLQEVAKAATNGGMKEGQTYGNQVYSGGQLQDKANKYDPNQQLQWQVDKADATGQTAAQRSAELFDPNSQRNKNLLTLFQKQAADASPTADSMYGALHSTGATNAGFFASKWAAAQSSKAKELGMQAWSTQMLANQGQALGWTNAEIGAQSLQANIWENKAKLEAQKRESDRSFWGGLVNSVFGLGGGLLANGLFGGDDTPVVDEHGSTQ